MTRAKRVGLVLTFLLVGLTPLFTMRALLGSSAPDRDASVSDDSVSWPWPYCAPDAAAPAYEALPVPPGGGFVHPAAFEPVARTLVPIEVIGDVQKTLSEDGFEGVEVRRIAVGKPLFQAEGFPAPSSDAEDLVVAAGATLWGDARSVLEEGSEVVLGIDARWDDGTYAVSFMLDAAAPAVLPPWSDYSPLNDFIAGELGPEPSPEAYLALVTEWNEARHTDSLKGTVAERWDEYLAKRYGVGIDYPAPGSNEFWDAAPPRCRSLFDAPKTVLSGLTQIQVRIDVPEAVKGASDTVVCLRIVAGSMGCSELDVADPIEMQVWVDNLGVEVQLARLIGDGVSWRDRVTVTSIDATAALRGETHVTLGPELSGTNFDEIVEGLE